VGQCVGDTIGPGGIFRGLRHLAVFDGLMKDMADLCPGALVLQYSNPMAILTWCTALSGLRVVGLCHSVQQTARLLAGYCDVPSEELSYWVAGSTTRPGSSPSSTMAGTSTPACAHTSTTPGRSRSSPCVSS